MTPLFCLLVLAGVIARLLKYDSVPIDLGMKIGIIWIAFQIVRLTAAAFK